MEQQVKTTDGNAGISIKSKPLKPKRNKNKKNLDSDDDRENVDINAKKNQRPSETDSKKGMAPLTMRGSIKTKGVIPLSASGALMHSNRQLSDIGGKEDGSRISSNLEGYSDIDISEFGLMSSSQMASARVPNKDELAAMQKMLDQAGQGHLLQYIDELNDQEKAALFVQINMLNPMAANALYNSSMQEDDN